MKYIVYTLISLLVTPAYAQIAAAVEPTVKIAVIDTGYSGQFATKRLRESLCKTGHFDVVLNSPSIGYDVIGHGTHVANLLFERAKTSGACLLVYKIIDPWMPGPSDAIFRALVKAYRAGANVINMSVSINRFSDKERRAIKYLTNKGVRIFVSAGNDSADLNKVCNTFPSCYKGLNENFSRVGSVDKSNLPETYSNKGLKVDLYEYGTLINVGRGTSFASPRAAGNYVRETYGSKK